MAESSLQGQISVGSIIENISKKSSLKWIISFIAVGKKKVNSLFCFYNFQAL